MRQNRGKKVDVEGIDGDAIDRWMKSQSEYKTFIRCQTLTSLAKGVSMNTVCEVLGVNRESARRWKQQYRESGINGLSKSKRKGKSPYLDNKKKNMLTKILGSPPKKYGCIQLNWTGSALKKLVARKWNINISVRTAQVWIKAIK